MRILLVEDNENFCRVQFRGQWGRIEVSWWVWILSKGQGRVLFNTLCNSYGHIHEQVSVLLQFEQGSFVSLLNVFDE